MPDAGGTATVRTTLEEARLRMSDAPPKDNFYRQLSTRWQIPLLVLSGVMLVLGVWRLRPAPHVPTFDEQFARAVALKDAALYPEASAFAEHLLRAPELAPDEKRRLHRLMAEVIFRHESGNAVHGETNARRILQHSDLAPGAGESHDAETSRMRALAWEWRRQPASAVAEYRRALAQGVRDFWEIRKRVLEIEETIGGMTAEQFHAAYDEFLAAPDVSDELRYWAASAQVDLYGREDQHDEAERFLAAHAAEFQDSPLRAAYEYLQALAWYHLGRLDDAERLVRVLRDGLAPADALYTRSGWLLGTILLKRESPEFALGVFEDVVRNAGVGAYRTACILGQAEALAGLERFDESVEAYHEAIRLTAEDPYGTLVDLKVVRESTHALYQALLVEDRLPEAMAYLRMAVDLVPPADDESQAGYAERLADLAFVLGERIRRRADAEGWPDDDPRRQEAGRHLRTAGDEYLRLAKFRSLDGSVSSEAIWKAADAFDAAGERRRTAEVLEAFIRERPVSVWASKVLLRLGETYEVAGDYTAAIAKYEQSLVEFPRQPAAVACLVRLADCFIATGRPDKAEEVLLRVVVRRPGDPLSLITPAAPEYRDALYRLGDLYARTGAFEKAIARYEEALERYGTDERADRAAFMLAEAYRRSAARIRDDLSDPNNIVHKDDLRATHQERLRRAAELYDQVLQRYRSRPEADLADLDRLHVKLSYLHRADVVYDRSRVDPRGEPGALAEALELYDRAAWVYQKDPMALSAYVQMISCHLRMGHPDKARMTLQRARWALNGIPDDQLAAHAPEEDRVYWEGYLSWLERAPSLASVGSGSPG